ncbi:MAG TPA: endolytic transglycosylase MltG [Acidimicrobiales bacterium]
MRRRRLRRTVGLLLAIVVVALAAGVYWVQGQLDPRGPAGAAVRVEIPSGSSTGAIADQLDRAGVITNATVFRLYLKARGAGGFEAGSYDLHLKSSMGMVLDTLSAGPSLPPSTRLTIPEGLTLAQTSERVAKVDHLAAAPFLAAASDGSVRSAFEPAGSNNLEGLVFPETYRIDQDEDEKAVLQQMVSTFDSVGTELGLGNSQQLVGYTPYQVVIVASLIEAEAKSDADRPKIARVIYNRLAAHMPLGIDSAFYYALPADRRGTSLRESDLTKDGPYNTRTRAGLVPTPIMAPGRASLAAALNPAPGSWLYYVLQDSTTHAFSTTYTQFLKDKAAAEKAGLIP